MDALLVLPGFAYNRDGESAIRALGATVAADGFDLFVPAYISRSGLAASRATLQQFIRDQRLDRYHRVHVFAFIAGAWTFNPLVNGQPLPNLATVMYDRSPYQERAPRIAVEKFRLLTWLRYGSPVSDIAKTAYPSLAVPGVNVGVVVETQPTSFIKQHEKTARKYGPFRFECDALLQRYDDCMYVHLSHDEMYLQLGDIWPELRDFIRTGRFTSLADRLPPAEDRLGNGRDN